MANKGRSRMPPGNLRKDAMEHQRRETIGKHHAQNQPQLAQTRANSTGTHASPRPQTGSERRAERNKAAKTIQNAFKNFKDRKSGFYGVVREAVDTRRQQLASPLVNAPGNSSRAHKPGGAGREFTTNADGHITQISLFNKNGDISEQIDFAGHENGQNLSGHHHVMHTPGDIGSSRGRRPNVFREAHYPAATMDQRVWQPSSAGEAVPPMASTPGSAGPHNPKNLPRDRTNQMGAVAAASGVATATRNSTPGAGSTHTEQRAAYLAGLRTDGG
ncbi:hypothetical protein KIH87_07340 [Paraneptunicella aestuarii]|uniref:hypothetical protein n=1 Tax=Paraneptunicella aestuarii TaxID=2831148 RepID=UPI001E506E46|nr:hypothetical protein [Paraneptunicella aestuarii]UAA40152.1 hypothetical protein KIH87_07340 [Paraneptunicella aestuarii]